MKTNARRIPGMESMNRVAANVVAAIFLLLSIGDLRAIDSLGLPGNGYYEWKHYLSVYDKLSCDFNGERKDLRKLCDEFDSYGGQPVIEGKVKEDG